MSPEILLIDLLLMRRNVTFDKQVLNYRPCASLQLMLLITRLAVDAEREKVHSPNMADRVRVHN